MTIGEYRNHLKDTIKTATEQGAYPTAKICLHLLQKLPDDAPANILTFGEIVFILDVAFTLADDAYREQNIVGGERWVMYLEFLSQAEAQKLLGKAIDLATITSWVKDKHRLGR